MPKQHVADQGGVYVERLHNNCGVRVSGGRTSTDTNLTPYMADPAPETVVMEGVCLRTPIGHAVASCCLPKFVECWANGCRAAVGDVAGVANVCKAQRAAKGPPVGQS